MNEAPISYLDVIEFWLGNEGLRPEHMGEREQFWFGADPSIDALIKERFGVLVETVVAGGCTDWESQSMSRLALIIVLDQFPRNIHRGRAGAFAGDARAERLALDAIERGMDREVGLIERGFFYLPLQHSEDLATQDRSVEVSQRQDAERAAAFENFEGKSLNYAREHRDVVARFGRFPHRNKALGRRSTEEELAYLTGGAPDYGQGSAES